MVIQIIVHKGAVFPLRSDNVIVTLLEANKQKMTEITKPVKKIKICHGILVDTPIILINLNDFPVTLKQVVSRNPVSTIVGQEIT